MDLIEVNTFPFDMEEALNCQEMLVYLMAQNQQHPDHDGFDHPDAKQISLPTQDSTLIEDNERTSANTTAASDSLFDSFPDETTFALSPKRRQSETFS